MAASLLRKFKGSKYQKGFYLFKQAGGGQNKYHITEADSDESLCGSHSIGAIDRREKFKPKSLDKNDPVEFFKYKCGLGKGVCQLCTDQWVHGKRQR